MSFLGGGRKGDGDADVPMVPGHKRPKCHLVGLPEPAPLRQRLGCMAQG
eukprot:CAMPEP_0196595662 /NCGR_PEP_ID=MMETSP1081-20130531/81810_1 /TAXON_ID=36882 /ORGANISM="Pyramimonas amylifera, Strain CCMP720" /LENGTH=48 /DNA_ID= /DNA_START= /DNA_END= /DNA_ORIENTATION=